MRRHSNPPGAVAEVIDAQGHWERGHYYEPEKGARGVKGLRAIRGLPIGTKLYTAPTLRPVSDGDVEAAITAMCAVSGSVPIMDELTRRRMRAALESFLARLMGEGNG